MTKVSGMFESQDQFLLCVLSCLIVGWISSSDHRKPTDHRCPVDDEIDVRVPICPLCNQLIVKTKRQDVNVQVQAYVIVELPLV